MFTELDTAENKEVLTGIITELQQHILSLDQSTLSPHQSLALRLIEQYGLSDIGILFT